MTAQLTFKFGWRVENAGFVPPGGRVGNMDEGRTVSLADGIAATEPFVLPAGKKAKVWEFVADIDETFVSMLIQTESLGASGSTAGPIWVEVKADKPTSAADLTALGTHVVWDSLACKEHLPLALPTQEHLVAAAETGSFIDRLIAATAEVGLIYEVWVYNPHATDSVRVTVSRAK